MARDSGTTLVEVLVALGLSGTIVVAALALAHSIALVSNEEGQVQAAQENLRGALVQLIRDVRVSGGGMAGGPAQNAATHAPATLAAISVVDGNPDQLDLLLPSGAAVGTTLQAVLPTDTAIIVDATGGAGFSSGDFALLTDYVNGVLYQVAHTQPHAISGINGVALGVGAAPAFPVAQYAAGSLVLKALPRRYTVQDGGPLGLPATSLLVIEDGAPLGAAGVQPAPVAENIYDLEVAVGIDGINGQPADGALSEVGAAANDDEWVFNVAGESLPAPPYQLRALRVSVVARTALSGAGLGPGRPAVEDNPGGPPDHYKWRVMTETIMIRNLVLR